MFMFAEENHLVLEKLEVHRTIRKNDETIKPFRLADLAVIGHMRAISIGEMESVKLMNRTDTKYILPVSRVPDILQLVSDKYDILEVEGNRISSYETIYYDDPDFRFFHDHINGKLNRNKVRTRKYIESALDFLEVKKKTNTGRTKKYRTRIDPSHEVFDEEARQLVGNYTQADLILLSPVLINRFKRITLVNPGKTERVTIDLDLHYASLDGKMEIAVPGLSIIEIKQNRFSFSSMGETLRNNRIKKTGISKYCLGIYLLEPGEKVNIYKRKIRTIKKITHHEIPL